MDDQTLSLRLYDILDWIGASEEMRGKYRERSIVEEIVFNIVSHLRDGKPCLCYVLGSRFEGTTTTGLNSDVDALGCFYEPVVEIISDAPQYGLSYLMVTDDTTKPGYCKLQEIINKVPMYSTDESTVNGCVRDKYDRLCVQHYHTRNNEYPEMIHGPAITRTEYGGGIDKDNVFALKCQHIPSFATSWVTRVTRCNRLNQTQIQTMKEFGCFFVGINHPLSRQEDPIEWRLSFSLQERELMSNLNPTQHKCYILLKMIKKDIINTLKNEKNERIESISSYHCKTCLLYAIEKTPCEFWTRRKLLECVLLCIKLLLHWVVEQYCPNYFIPEENMFDKIKHGTLRRVQFVLEDMVRHWCRFLWSITCDDIFNVMTKVLFGGEHNIMRTKHNNVSEKALELYIHLIGTNQESTVLVLRHCNSISVSNTIVELQQLQTHIVLTDCVRDVLTDCVRDHNEKETRQAIRYFIPHLCLQIAQCIASIMLSTIDTHRLRLLFGEFKYNIEESKNCDTISANLISASYCLQSDRNDICENFLHQCETTLKSHVLPVCSCFTQKDTYRDETVNELQRMLGSQDIPYTEFARTCTAGCLVFLPHQANIVPPALHYEMYRSVYTPHYSRNEFRGFLFDWMLVDSKVYLYFMQYILYSKTNKPIYKQDAIKKLFHVLNTEDNLGHEETAFNLLGWIFKQENQIQRAMECFLISWRIRPIHNAAKWHLLELIRFINSLNSDRHML